MTGDRPGAGTDANVFITIYGKNGDSGNVKLEGAHNCFERNKTDVFEIESVDLGEIKKIRIGVSFCRLGSNRNFNSTTILSSVHLGFWTKSLL